MWHLREASHTNFASPTVNLLDQRKRYQKLQIYYIFNHIDFNGSNKFLQLIGPITEQCQ